MIKVIPAINTGIVSELRRFVSIAESLSRIVDVDISDGRFTPTKTVSIMQVGKVVKKKISIHYMGFNILPIVNKLSKNTSQFTFHYEACKDEKELFTILKVLKSKRVKAFIGLTPDTPLETIKHLVKKHNNWLLLTVYPGRSGQSMITKRLQIIPTMKLLNAKINIRVDGGVHLNRAMLLKKYNPSSVVATSEIFNADNPKNAFKALKEALN